MIAPTRFPGGITNVGQSTNLGQLGILDPTLWVSYMNDFFVYTAGDWTITTTEAGAGAATEALTSGAGGYLLITNDDADNDADFFQLKGEAFKFASGKKAFFKAKFKVSDATQSDVVMGLQITDTTPLAVTDGVYFRKDDGDTNLDFVVIKDSTDTTATAVTTLANDTFVEVGFYYDGSSAIEYFVNNAKAGTSSTTNLPDDEELTISFGIQNGEAVAKTMTIDYVFAAVER